jgi:integrase
MGPNGPKPRRFGPIIPLKIPRTMKSTNRAVHVAEPTTWHDAVERFKDRLVNERRSEYTIHHYSDDLKAFALWWEKANPDVDLCPAVVTEEDLRDWQRHLDTETLKSGDTRMPATVNAKMAAVKSFLGWCHRKKVLAMLPEFPHPLKLGTRAVKWLDEKQERKLMRDMARDSDARALPIALALLESGLRLSEFVALLRKDVIIRERKGDVEVRKGKGNKPRTVPLSKKGRRAFEALFRLNPDGTPSDPVTTSRRTNPATKRRVALSGRALQDILEPYGVHPHQLRHTFGMRLQKAGVALPVIAKLMGHASVITTMVHYSTPSETDLRQAVDPDGDDD